MTRFTPWNGIYWSFWQKELEIADAEWEGGPLESGFVNYGSSALVQRELLNQAGDGSLTLHVWYKDIYDHGECDISFPTDTGSGMLFLCQAAVDEKTAITQVKLDDTPLAAGDYEVRGSALVILKACLDKLDVGEHTVTCVLADGKAMVSDGAASYATTDESGAVTLQPDYTEGDNWNLKFQNGTLTLRNAVISGILGQYDGTGIYCPSNLTIVLEGENVVTSAGAADAPSSCGISCGNELVLEGGGTASLTVSGGQGEYYSSGIDTYGNLRISGCTVEAVGGASVDSTGIYCSGDVTLENCTVTASASGWLTVIEATETTEGLRHKVCTVCGYELETETIPAIVVIGGVDAGGIRLTLSNGAAGTCLAALYDSDGRLLTAASLETAAGAGDVSISFPDFEGQPAAVKVFFLDEDYAPIYRCVTEKM